MEIATGIVANLKHNEGVLLHTFVEWDSLVSVLDTITYSALISFSQGLNAKQGLIKTE